ncbi:MAG: DUF350 domain-containing protein [Desulfobacteraceae bacterium]|nr:MAG: DUF350 domain-containing protein [Desulfobacteraceae bacterium]
MNIAEILSGMGQGIVFVIICILFIWLAKQIDDWRTSDFDDDIQIDDGNAAVGLRRAGLYLAIAIALSGALSGAGRGFVSDLFILLLDGVIILACMFSCRWINDKVMLGHISNDEECIREFIDKKGITTKGNTAVGMVEAGIFIATGFILRGSLSGEGGTFIQGIESTFFFFVAGQICLLAFGYLYEIITPFNVREEIKDNNLAAGVGLGGILIALGIVLQASIAGPFTGWENDIVNFAFYAFAGVILLLAFRVIIEKLLLPTTNLATEVKEDRNVAALIVAQCAINAVAIIIAFSL